ncbi:flagellar export chaperone FliS [Halarsenatibacter silvermanii]|uniref:Flagellar protein FliS n=1 Tax=Halarsenatibacter silvermanii TaxID=321763 RepID=A0A1G9M1H4_9FIRM|nr:flagellar export chaperone FliS [Halarsenatibacter silvermanii]SDL67973.1 flagellar protein FliS [Halarsenatibacter silvermanii]
MNRGYNGYNNNGIGGNGNNGNGGNGEVNGAGTYGQNGNTAQKYQKTSIETADDGKLVVELYKGAIKFMKLARKQIEEENPMEANNLLIRVQNIITELMNTLDFEQGGELAANLEALYDYMLNELVQANLDKDAERIKNVEDMMMQLLESWQEAAKEARKEKRRQEKVRISAEGQ